VKRRDLERHLRAHGCREIGGSKHAKWRGPTIIKPVVILLIAAVLAAVLAAKGASGAPAREAGCLPRRAHAVAEDREVRIYSLTAPYMIGTHRYTHEVSYACLRRSGAIMKLTAPDRRQLASTKLLALNGTMVAYTISDFGVDTGSTEIVTADVATRRFKLTVPAAGGFTDACVIYFREIKDLAVTDRGSVAWIARVGHGCKTETFQVLDSSSFQEPTLLDEGLEVAPESLRTTKRGISWEDARRRLYALLP
jgi:hypothetical protein